MQSHYGNLTGSHYFSSSFIADDLHDLQGSFRSLKTSRRPISVKMQQTSHTVVKVKVKGRRARAVVSCCCIQTEGLFTASQGHSWLVWSYPFLIHKQLEIFLIQYSTVVYSLSNRLMTLNDGECDWSMIDSLITTRDVNCGWNWSATQHCYSNWHESISHW